MRDLCSSYLEGCVQCEGTKGQLVLAPVNGFQRGTSESSFVLLRSGRLNNSRRAQKMIQGPPAHTKRKPFHVIPDLAPNAALSHTNSRKFSGS